MDENLFQLVTVGLLGVMLLVLLVTLLTLNKVAKKIEEGAPARAETPYQSEAHEGTPQAAVAAQEPEPAADKEEPAVAPAQVEEPQPVAATPTSVQEPEPAQASTGFEDAPEEQPFERDGRWWFKRGDELLVYDEQSGQWESAPAGAATSPVPPVVPAADSGSEQLGASPATGGEAESAQAAQDPGSFWKCPSCGAVNGSTATSCRMCFAPKP